VGTVGTAKTSMRLAGQIMIVGVSALAGDETPIFAPAFVLETDI
jgi:hypothetical protein